MEPDFSRIDSTSAGGREVLNIFLNRRQVLGLGVGSFLGTIYLSSHRAQAEEAASPSLTANTVAQPHGENSVVDITPTNPNYFIPDRFAGKTLLVTGAATGIGAATAIRAAREGANVIGLDRKATELNQTVSQIKDEGHKVLVC